MKMIKNEIYAKTHTSHNETLCVRVIFHYILILIKITSNINFYKNDKITFLQKII